MWGSFGLLLGAIVLASCSSGDARPVSLAESVIGKTLHLPDQDLYGRTVPREPIRLFSLPCGGCADLSALLASASPTRPLLLVTSDQNATRSLPDLRHYDGVYLVVDASAAHVPRSILDYPPIALRLDQRRRVVAQESGAAQVFAFLGVLPQNEQAIQAGRAWR